MNNIYLIGMPGSGKTVTARLLSAKMQWACVDLDSKVQRKEGRTIVEIFEARGEPYFRQQERAMLREVAAAQKQVISAGGGIVLSPDNIQTLKSTGFVIYLNTSVEFLWKRVKDKPHRPLLNLPDAEDALRKIFESREGFYKEAADYEILTDGKSPEEVALGIFEEVKKRL